MLSSHPLKADNSTSRPEVRQTQEAFSTIMSALRDVGEFTVDRRHAGLDLLEGEAGDPAFQTAPGQQTSRDDQAAAFLRLLFAGAACWASLGFLPRPMVFAKAERAAA